MDHFEKVDVLIVGAGPAGLMAANALAGLGVSIKVIEKRYGMLFRSPRKSQYAYHAHMTAMLVLLERRLVKQTVHNPE